MSATLLEVIALSPEDARAARDGGADRLEVVSAIDVGGLTPSLRQFQRIRAAVDLPLRVMLRTNDGFEISARELERLLEQVRDLRIAGADQFVFGFLDSSGTLDLNAIGAIQGAIAPCPWTLHHAFDHALDARIAWNTASSLSHLDCVLSGGVQGDLGQGLSTLCERAAWQTGNLKWLAGGGLILERIGRLRAAGICNFHVGRAARHGHSWSKPVNPAAIARLKEAINDGAMTDARPVRERDRRGPA